MKTLLILRHAKSSWDDPALEDHDRPLNDRGRRDAPRVGLMLKERNTIPDAILSSTAYRAQDTAKRICEHCSLDIKISSVPDFYPGRSQNYIQALSELPDDVKAVMVVGHNPGLEEFLASLTGVHEDLPTAALAHLELPINDWKELSIKTKATLIHIWRPKLTNSSFALGEIAREPTAP